MTFYLKKKKEKRNLTVFWWDIKKAKILSFNLAWISDFIDNFNFFHIQYNVTMFFHPWNFVAFSVIFVPRYFSIAEKDNSFNILYYFDQIFIWMKNLLLFMEKRSIEYEMISAINFPCMKNVKKSEVLFVNQNTIKYKCFELFVRYSFCSKNSFLSIYINIFYLFSFVFMLL